MQIKTQYFIKAKSAEELANKMFIFSAKMYETYEFNNIGKQGNEWYAWFTINTKLMDKAKAVIEGMKASGRQAKKTSKDSN